MGDLVKVRPVEKLGGQETPLTKKELEDRQKARLVRGVTGKIIIQVRKVAKQVAKARKDVGKKMKPYWYRYETMALHEI